MSKCLREPEITCETAQRGPKQRAERLASPTSGTLQNFSEGDFWEFSGHLYGIPTTRQVTDRRLGRRARVVQPVRFHKSSSRLRTQESARNTNESAGQKVYRSPKTMRRLPPSVPH